MTCHCCSGLACQTERSTQTNKAHLSTNSLLSSPDLGPHVLQSSHDLEVRSWISRVQRLSACAQGAKSSDSKASMSAFARLHQEGDAWQCGAVRAGAPAAASMCKEGARARAGTPSLLLTAARVSSITRHRAAVLRVMQGEARAARAGEAFCACRALLRCVPSPSARRQCWAYILQVHGKTGYLLGVAV